MASRKIFNSSNWLYVIFNEMISAGSKSFNKLVGPEDVRWGIHCLSPIDAKFGENIATVNPLACSE